MELEFKTRILAGMTLAQNEAHETAVRAGHWQKQRNIAEAVAMIHRDVSKALEIAAIGDGPSQKLPDCTRLEEKLADVIIRTLDLGGGMGLHLSPALLLKMEYNEKLSKVVKTDF